MYATALCALADPATRRLTLACAGHPPPLLCREGRVTRLACENAFPILMMEMLEPRVTTHELCPGDRVLFYTDGVTERLGPRDELYDEERLTYAFARATGADPDSLVRHLVTDLEAFAEGHEPEDDQTLLLMAMG